MSIEKFAITGTKDADLIRICEFLLSQIRTIRTVETDAKKHMLVFHRYGDRDDAFPINVTATVLAEAVRQMMNAYIKQAINFCETLFTPHIIINPRYEAEVAELRAHAEEIASADLYQQLRTTEGMLQSQMVKAHAPTTPTIADSPTRMKRLARAMHC